MNRILALATLFVVGLAAALLGTSALAQQEKKGPAQRSQAKKDPTLSDEGFKAIFDGKTLNGWHISAESGHSRASGNKSGGKWVVEDGAIVGTQDIPGNGGIVITDAAY